MVQLIFKCDCPVASPKGFEPLHNYGTFTWGERNPRSPGKRKERPTDRSTRLNNLPKNAHKARPVPSRSKDVSNSRHNCVFQGAKRSRKEIH